MGTKVTVLSVFVYVSTVPWLHIKFIQDVKLFANFIQRTFVYKKGRLP